MQLQRPNHTAQKNKTGLSITALRLKNTTGQSIIRGVSYFIQWAFTKVIGDNFICCQFIGIYVVECVWHM